MKRSTWLLVSIGVLVVGIVGGSMYATAENVAPRCGGGCVMNTPPESTPLVLLARTHALYNGEANISLTETLGGIKLMVQVLDRSHQPDPNASVRVYGTGHFGSRGFTLSRVSPGVYAAMANLANVDELAVRVLRPGTSQLIYVGIPGRHIGGRCGGDCAGGGTCRSTAGGPCAGMSSGQCSEDCDQCPHAKDCKACKAGAACPMRDKCKLHQAGQGCSADCDGKGANCAAKGDCPMRKGCGLHQAQQGTQKAGQGCGMQKAGQGGGCGGSCPKQ